MSRTRVLLLSLLLLTLTICVTLPAFAQYGASIEGTVTDKSGAVVAKANITITNQETGVSRTMMTSDAGFYRVSGLTPGRYKVDVEATGFRKDTTADVEVDRKSTRLNSSHLGISYAVFCLKKK